MTRVSFSLTHFMYDDESPILGNFMSIVSLAPIFIIVMYCSEILLHRDIHTVFLLIGQLLNLFLNIFLKKTLKIPRPETALQTNNGMPSDHMQFMGFFATYVILWLYKRVSFEYVWQRIGATVFIVLLTASIFVSRFVLGEHYIDQLVVGSIIGCITGTLWFFVNTKVLSKYYSYFLNMPLFKVFYFKDYSNIPNTLRFEYENANRYTKEKEE